MPGKVNDKILGFPGSVGTLVLVVGVDLLIPRSCWQTEG